MPRCAREACANPAKLLGRGLCHQWVVIEPGPMNELDLESMGTSLADTGLDVGDRHRAIGVAGQDE